jgi:hypothetical protein
VRAAFNFGKEIRRYGCVLYTWEGTTSVDRSLLLFHWILYRSHQSDQRRLSVYRTKRTGWTKETKSELVRCVRRVGRGDKDSRRLTAGCVESQSEYNLFCAGRHKLEVETKKERRNFHN